MSTVAIIDYGMGNLHSIAKALQHVSENETITVTSDATAILNASRVVFPGVGAMRDCMKALHALNLIPVIKQVTQTKPFLGICLGMQALLTDSKENGYTEGIGIFDGHVLRFSKQLSNEQETILKIPHMGWNQVRQQPHPLWQGIADNSYFYFVHSYYAQPQSESQIAGFSDYPNAFACALMKDNVFAVQFHPEKSAALGLQLLRNFLVWNGNNVTA